MLINQITMGGKYLLAAIPILKIFDSLTIQ